MGGGELGGGECIGACGVVGRGECIGVCGELGGGCCVFMGLMLWLCLMVVGSCGMGWFWLIWCCCFW